MKNIYNSKHYTCKVTALTLPVGQLHICSCDFSQYFWHYFGNLDAKIYCHKPSHKLVCGWKTLNICFEDLFLLNFKVYITTGF